MSEQHIKVFTLASSSKGNAVYIRYGSDEILIDAGISAKRLECALMSLGSSLKNIQAIFVTHEHSDHISGLATVSKKYGIPVHLTEKSGHAMLNQAKYAPVAECAVLHTPVYSETVGSLEVRSFPTPHDSVCSVGFTVMAGNDTFALATDLGHISPDVEAALTGAENVILESNHDENMLLCGSYPYDVKLRILSDFGHLSNETSAAFAKKLAVGGTKHILLAHLSPENNLPELALACAKEDDAVTSQRSAIESFLDSRGWEYAEASGVYRYTINADRPEYESEPQIAYGDSVVFDFAAYLFSGSVSATEVPYYTNIRSLVEGDTVLNTEYWSFEPQRVVLGATPMIRGLTYGLQGARESDSLQLFVTSDLAYGSGNTGVVDGDQATRWFVYIEKVIKNE